MSTGMIMARTPRILNAELAESAERLLMIGVLCVLCVLCVLNPSRAVAAPPVRTMYTEAMAREQMVRAAMAAPEAAPRVLGDVRATVAAYEAVVRRYPASGYSDNALWQAGRLSLDAFTRFGQAPDKDAGVRILKKLAATYPTSKLARQVPEQLTRADQPGTMTETTPPPQAPSSKLATIKDIRRAVLPDAVRITIELDSEVAFHEERIQDPARVFVDLPGTRAVAPLVDQTLRFEGDADIVRQVRIGRHPNNTTRVVLDAAGVTSYSVYPLYSPYRLVIDCVRVPAVAAAAMTDKVLARVPPPPPPAPKLSTEGVPVRALTARAMTNPWLRKLPGLTPSSSALIAVARVTVDRATEIVVVDKTPAPLPRQSAEGTRPAASGRQSAEGATTPPARPSTEGATEAPAHNASGGLSMARQLGLGVSRIVIDPGHGGHDSGAKGKGVNESELVLDVALRLEKLLQKVPGVEVILTRRTDEFIQLPERTAIANRDGADLFLSIHANASANAQAHGIETYFLNFANNQSAAAVAARENAASTQAMGGLPDFVKAIALNNKLDESRDFALHVQRAMVERQRTANKVLKDLGVKQAPFVVLIGANMPSVLAEMGFVTNAQEGKLLKGNAYRQKIAESLFTAIRKYQTSLKNVPTVAHQNY